MAAVRPPPDPKIYTNVAKDLPPEVTHNDIVQSIPKEYFELCEPKAWLQFTISTAGILLGLYLIKISPWYLLPFAWAYCGTALTGYFVVGHDCGHRTFSRNELVNDIVGTFAFLPMFYPYESWRIQHNLHHNHTNKLYVDNAWQPFLPEHYDNAPAWEQAVLRAIRSWPQPFFWISSFGHQVYLHYKPSLFKEGQQRRRVQISVALCAAYGAVFFPAMLYFGGFWTLFKYWFVPLCGFHFWLSTLTLVHHTLPHIPFKPEPQWRNAESRLGGTAHCDYPLGLEWFFHQINVHTPHHVSTRIPSYNLRKAHHALRVKWGPYLNECVFGWGLMKDILTNCSLYHEELNYTPFVRDASLMKKSSDKQAKSL